MVSSLQSIESSNRPIIGSSCLGAGGRGRSPSYSPHPFRGAGRAGSVSRICSISASGRPRPLPPAPAQSAPKSICFFYLTKRKAQIQRMGSNGGSRGPIGTYFGCIWVTFLKLGDTKVTVWVAGLFLLLFLVAFRSGRREEKHGIYCVGHTLPTLIKSNVLHSF